MRFVPSREQIGSAVSIAIIATVMPLDAQATRQQGYPQFKEMQPLSGIDYRNVSGDAEKQFIVSSLGSGVGMIDYDADGDLDLYFVNGARLVDRNPQPGESNELYRNDGNWRFTEVASQAGVGDDGWGFGVAVGDIDNDGLEDLYVTNIGANVLYRNRGDGTFENVSLPMRVSGSSWSTSAAFFDADSDGDLDLYVANYADPDVSRIPLPGSRPSCQWFGLPVFCGPSGLAPQADVFYRNDGHEFTDASQPAGLTNATSAFGLGVVTGDYDNDGNADIYVANDSVPNFLFHNLGDGLFEETALIAGVAYNVDGLAQAGMGVDMGDLDGDQRLDIFVTNFSHDTNTAYRNTESGFFADATSESKLRMPSWFYLGWGTGFADFDGDDDLDLFVANGHVYPSADDDTVDTTYRQKNQVFWNRGGGAFELANDEELSPESPLAQIASSRGSAIGDLDNDGDPDVVVTNIDSIASVMRNEANSDGTLIRLVGRDSTRSAIGTRIEWQTENGSQIRESHSSGSFLSARDSRVLIPRNDAAPHTITVRWPSGKTLELDRRQAPRGIWVVVEPSS